MQLMRRQLTLVFAVLFALAAFLSFFTPTADASNIINFKDTISDSGPDEQSNHTFEFKLLSNVSPGGTIEITPPAGFTLLSTTTFGVRNVELYVDGAKRTASSVASAGIDQVDITTGSPGFIRYTLAPDFSISSGSDLELRIGNHSSVALDPVTSYSTSTGTTTTQADAEPIVNSSTLGVHEVKVEVYDGSRVANANFVIFLNEKVNIPGVDTTETIPPERFNPTPTSTIGGTTLYVEISLETNEFAWCRYDTVAGTGFYSMTNVFSNTGLVYHSTVVPITPNTFNEFFVRCIDDEGNYNIDDFIISFFVNDIPTGASNTDGNVSGDGTGSGNDGSGSGGGSGGTTGNADGQEPLEGSSAGSGGAGGGGGGGTGGDTGTTGGGGFEGGEQPYQSGDGRVIISGYAYPNSTVGILVDGNFYDTITANSSGVYSVTLDAIARGVYTFGVYGEGPDGVKSSTFSTSFTVTGARTSHLSNVNVAPSILVAPDPVDPGQTLTVSGYALPNATVTIENGRINRTASGEFTATTDSNGRWSTTINTTGFTVDTYQVRAKSAQDGGVSTHFSEYTFYGVGQEADVPLNADLNVDGKVNLVDFSILLFWWNSDGGDSNPPADINRDGKVSLTDFSIMLFQWTG